MAAAEVVEAAADLEPPFTPIQRSPTMMFDARLARRSAAAAIGIGATLLAFAAPALADPPPNCTAADRAGVAAGVSAATSVYLFTHPDVNDFFTGLKGMPVEDVRSEVRDYLDGYPQARDELQGIRQPLQDFRERCGVDPGQA
jgi:hemophore-related protein